MTNDQEQGRSFICTHCHHIWLASGTDEDDLYIVMRLKENLNNALPKCYEYISNIDINVYLLSAVYMYVFCECLTLMFRLVHLTLWWLWQKTWENWMSLLKGILHMNCNGKLFWKMYIALSL